MLEWFTVTGAFKHWHLLLEPHLHTAIDLNQGVLPAFSFSIFLSLQFSDHCMPFFLISQKAYQTRTGCMCLPLCIRFSWTYKKNIKKKVLRIRLDVKDCSLLWIWLHIYFSCGLIIWVVGILHHSASTGKWFHMWRQRSRAYLSGWMNRVLVCLIFEICGLAKGGFCLSRNFISILVYFTWVLSVATRASPSQISPVRGDFLVSK